MGMTTLFLVLKRWPGLVSRVFRAKYWNLRVGKIKRRGKIGQDLPPVRHGRQRLSGYCFNLGVGTHAERPRWLSYFLLEVGRSVPGLQAPLAAGS